MKQVRSSSSRGLLLAYRILTALLLLLVALIITFTVFAFARPKGSKPLFSLNFSNSNPAKNDSVAKSGRNAGTSTPDSAAVFNGIGRLRIPIAAYPPGGSATMVLSIAFPYPPDDGPFTEELASHIGDFRGIATDYFAALPAEKITQLDEGAAKAEILRRYNALLRLGKISALYFNDLMIVE